MDDQLQKSLEARKAMMPANVRAAHAHSTGHRTELAESAICGCFYCSNIFAPNAIVEWIDDGRTALCPSCTVDSVIGSASGFPITREFLDEMHTYWF